MPDAQPLSTLTVFGFGLIGASVALAAKARWPAVRVIAIDRPPVLAAAPPGCDERVAHDDVQARQRAFASADLTVLAAPLSAIEAILPEAVEHCRLVTDCGSTKRSVLSVAASLGGRAHFVAGHPIAGKPEGGAALADAGLFRGRPWILCPAGGDEAALERVESFVRDLGALPGRMSAEAHDRALAVTSHAPQLLASLLLVLAEREQVPQLARGSGFDSATRVAGGPIGIWKDIFERNADQIAPSLEHLSAQLAALAQELRLAPAAAEQALKLLEDARRLRRP